MADMVAAFANTMLDAGMADLDGGTVELQEAGGTEVATGTLANPAASGSASGGELTFDAITKDDSAAGGGPITKAIFKNSGATALVRATCAESGAEITIDNDSPPAGVDVFFSSIKFKFTVVTL
jgi:hypothetical protein